MIPKYLFYWTIGRISKGLKNDLELATINEPPMIDALKFYCLC